VFRIECIECVPNITTNSTEDRGEQVSSRSVAPQPPQGSRHVAALHYDSVWMCVRVRVCVCLCVCAGGRAAVAATPAAELASARRAAL